MLRVVLAGPAAAGWATELARLLPFPHQMIPVLTLEDDQIAAALLDADVLVGQHFTGAMARRANRLRLIQLIGAGAEQVDLASLPPGVALCNVYEHETGIAEYVLMAALALSRRLCHLGAALGKGDWSSCGTYGGAPQPELRGKTLGLVGLGHIGRELARIAGALGMRVVVVKRHPDQRHTADLGLAFLGGPADLPRVLAEADFLVLALPLGPETRGMIGAAELRRMKPTSYLINVARGGVVDETALYEALQNRTIAGAALDVWWRYPVDARVRVLPSAYPFHELDNVLLTPHIAGWTEGTVRRRSEVIAENLRRLALGEPLLNVLAIGHDTGPAQETSGG